jgi:hypothetical protein
MFNVCFDDKLIIVLDLVFYNGQASFKVLFDVVSFIFKLSSFLLGMLMLYTTFYLTHNYDVATNQQLEFFFFND